MGEVLLCVALHCVRVRCHIHFTGKRGDDQSIGGRRKGECPPGHGTQKGASRNLGKNEVTEGEPLFVS